MYGVVNMFSNTSLAPVIGHHQMQSSYLFQLSSYEYSVLGGTGGDYGVVGEWFQYHGGGGAGGQCSWADFCPPQFVQ